jgi:hypothetical protein
MEAATLAYQFYTPVGQAHWDFKPLSSFKQERHRKLLFFNTP